MAARIAREGFCASYTLANGHANSLLKVILNEALAEAGRAGLPERPAHDVAESICESVSLRLWGMDVYVPVCARDRAARDRRIRAEFNGSNHGELSRQYGLSKGTIYRIVRGRCGD